jgi:hypothetical protein
MSLLHEAMNEKKFDSRLTERLVARGVMSSQELDTYLKTLPDDSENSDTVTLEDLERQERRS